MGWEDRQYYRDRSGSGGTPLEFLLYGSVPLFTAFGIRVRAHVSLLLFIGLTLLLGGLGSKTFNFADRAQLMTILFIIVLLHEFGHCFAARWVGGEAEDILMTPLGGLAMARPPHRPLPTFITVAAGPMVNVVICLLTAGAIAVLRSGQHWWNPVHFFVERGWPVDGWVDTYFYLYLFYTVSLALLLFNLLPIFPLDGGQMLQAALWPKLGHYRSMMFACVTGMVGAVILGLVGIMTSILLIFIAISGFMTCYMTRRNLKEAGPEYEPGMDFSESLRPDPPRKRRKVSRWTVRRLRREAQLESDLQSRIDAILAKVSAHGMQSLTWSERRTLKKATERQRRTELESPRRR
ncbi:MAG TPA: M50 family metallopeptidase [Tepidisphaeraceae bacterium]|jgi:Zn-dependent protease|nr:M50 family metallopeptidase [Tepidisphaeraceae bacterium]